LSSELQGGMAELGRRNVEMSLLAQMARTLDSSMSLTETLESVSVFTARLLPGTSGELFLYRNSRNLLEKALQWGDPCNPKEAIEPHECWGLRLGRVHQVSGKDALYCPHHDRNAAPDRSLFCLPLSAQGEIIGLMTIEVPVVLDIDAAHAAARVGLATALAEQLALALSNAKLKEVLKQQSIVDPLTGLFNRRYMDETLFRELSRARRKSCPLSLVMIDVDHFKSINDRHGHEAGDTVLRAVAEHIKASVREGDLVCRFGGEEMVILMPECDVQDAGARAEKLRAAIRSLHVSYGGHTIGAVTASFGVASYPYHAGDETTLIACADKAMYQAKSAGRDRVVVAEMPLVTTA
jgi:diguanylate cyclase (GGDEF)-like protein